MARDTKAQQARVQQKKPKGTSKTRKPDRQTEVGKQRLSVRRSAQELGITWLDAYCENSSTKGHLLVGKTKIDAGTVFECSVCHKVKWLPDDIDECIKLGNSMKIYGEDGGYQRILDKHPAAKRLMSKIQDIYYLRKALSPEQFPIAVAAVILDKEYPFDVEVKEEEAL